MKLVRYALIGAAFWSMAGDSRLQAGQQRRGSAPQTSAKETARESKNEGRRPELSFTTRVDRTAVWVGDQFHYQITVEHSPRIQFVLENLNKETINLDPLRVVDAASSTTRLKDGNQRLFVDLILANLTTGVAEIQIPQLTLFYFRKEAGATTLTSSEGAAAESLTIPGPVIGIRSTLPPGSSDLRDAVTVTGWPRSRWIVVGVGWCALIALVVGAGWEGVRLIRGRKGRQGPNPRAAMAAIHDRWSQSVPQDFSDPGVVIDFYGRSYHDVKDYLGYLLETHTAGLTAEDLREEMRRLAVSPDLTERAVKVLSICETARYGRNGKELSADVARGVADDVREIFQAGSQGS